MLSFSFYLCFKSTTLDSGIETLTPSLSSFYCQGRNAGDKKILTDFEKRYDIIDIKRLESISNIKQVIAPKMNAVRYTHDMICLPKSKESKWEKCAILQDFV